ncbi:MAG: 2-phosphosulfolactate phosphatase [Candidatus Heimdallarchaeota archaeon]
MEIILLGNHEGSQLVANKGGIAIIVDTLRASTTMPTAMSKGITTIYVALEVEDTRVAAKEFDSLLMGERGCKMLDGFDYGNSPVELNKQKEMSNKAAAFTSQTGAKRVVEAIGSQAIIVGAPINAQAVVNKIIEICKSLPTKNFPIVIIPAFTEGSIISNEITEDQIGGLVIAQEFKKAGFTLSKEILDELECFEKLLENQSLFQILLNTVHGQKLVELGFRDDVEFCSKINKISAVPTSLNDIEELPTGQKVVKLTEK